MRKDLLYILASETPTVKARLVLAFLRSEKSLAMDSEQISFNEFLEYLKRNGLIHNAYAESLQLISDSNSFKDFVAPSATQPSQQAVKKEATLTSTPPAASTSASHNTAASTSASYNTAVSTSASYNTAVSTNASHNTAVSTSASHNTAVSTSASHYMAASANAIPASISSWQQKLLDAGCNKTLLTNVMSLNIIRDYEQLYQGFCKMPFIWRKNIKTPWQLLAFSRDPQIIQYIFEKTSFKATDTTCKDETLLHLVALSGGISAFEKAVTLKDSQGKRVPLFLDRRAVGGVIHYAALSGVPEMLNIAQLLEDEEGRHLDPLSKVGYFPLTILDCAAWSGSLETFNLSLEINHIYSGKKIDHHSVSYIFDLQDFLSLPHYAAWGGSVAILQKSLSLVAHNPKIETVEINPKTTSNQRNYSITHLAVMNGNAATINESLGINNIETDQKVEPTLMSIVIQEVIQEGNPNRNDYPDYIYTFKRSHPDMATTEFEPLLHQAVKLGFPDVIIHLRILGHIHGIKSFAPSFLDKNGHDAFWHLENHCKVDHPTHYTMAKEALLAPIETLISIQQQKKTELNKKDNAAITFQPIYMQRIELYRLALKHQTLQAQLIIDFLRTEKSLTMDHEHVSFHEFKDYLKRNDFTFLPELEAKEFAGRTDVELYNRFVTMPQIAVTPPITHNKEPNQSAANPTYAQPSILTKLFTSQKSVLQTIVAPCMDAQATFNLGTSNSTWHAETQIASYWIDKFIAAGCNEKLLKNILGMKIIRDYKNLYQAFIKLPFVLRIQVKNPWELLALSGDPKAIAYIEKNERHNVNATTAWGATIVHLTALSGSISALEKSLTITDVKGDRIDTLALTKKGENCAHYAALGGSPHTLSICLSSKNANSQMIHPCAATTDGRTILDCAARSGSVKTLKRAESAQHYYEGYRNQFYSPDKQKKTSLHQASLSNSKNRKSSNDHQTAAQEMTALQRQLKW